MNHNKYLRILLIFFFYHFGIEIVKLFLNNLIQAKSVIRCCLFDLNPNLGRCGTAF
jgi:hypothetical protein